MHIDAHQHFWIFDPVRDSWINNDMKTIQRDFLPADLAPVLQQHQIDGCVAVQADQSEQQNDFLLALAKDHSFVKGVVGWVDFESEDIDERLAAYAQQPAMKGFRHILQGEVQRDYMLRPRFMQGIAQLAPYGFTYDILILPDQLPFTADFVKAFPGQKFVVDHLAKPFIKKQELEPWATNMARLGAFENVYCKVSGMVTEADWHSWQKPDFGPYLDAVFEIFGPARLMYGSDWPVCEVAGGYGKAFDMVSDYTSRLTTAEQAQFWGANAASFYQL